MSIDLHDVKYLDNVDQILKDKTQVAFVNRNYITVDEKSVGSSISTTFTKSVTNSFTWSL